MLKELPSARIRFDYEVYNTKGKLINQGYSVQAFINSRSRRPMRVPQFIKDLLEPHFKK
jgi:acyl-CoA thioester hydrolase